MHGTSTDANEARTPCRAPPTDASAHEATCPTRSLGTRRRNAGPWVRSRFTDLIGTDDPACLASAARSHLACEPQDNRLLFARRGHARGGATYIA